jgi:hypothetical protein
MLFQQSKVLPTIEKSMLNNTKDYIQEYQFQELFLYRHLIWNNLSQFEPNVSITRPQHSRFVL